MITNRSIPILWLLVLTMSGMPTFAQEAPVGPEPAQPVQTQPEQTRPEQTNNEINVFGEQLFRGHFAQETFAGFNPDYQISVGDRIAVQMWGAFEFAEVLTVDAQGNVFVPQVGPIRVLGVENQKLNDVIQNQIKKVFQANVRVYANLEASQPVKVFVTGFVRNPGLYNGLSSDSVLTYLDKAGGIDPQRGSYLDVKLLRNRTVRQEIDLYDFLLAGKLTRIQLHEGDTIVVAPRQRVIAFSGLVENPYLVEFAEQRITLLDGLAFAGPRPNATHVRVTRNQGTIRNVEYYPISEATSVYLEDGDEVEVTADKKPGTITVRVEGEHDSPQEYVLPYGTRLGEVLSRIEYNTRSASDSIQVFRRSVKMRQKEMLQRSLKSLEASVLTARSATSDEAQLRTQEAELILQWIDRAKEIEPQGQVVFNELTNAEGILLEHGDIIRVPAKDGLVMVSGEVMFPNAVVYTGKYELDDYIKAAGGYTQNAKVSQIIVRRRDGSFAKVDGGSWSGRAADVKAGDEILVLPRIDTKNLQITKDLTQVIYQIAVSAAVVLRM